MKLLNWLFQIKINGGGGNQRLKNLFLVFLSFFLLTPYLNAKDSVANYVLEKSVVTASGFAQELKDAPASISTIDQKNLESRPIRDLGEAVSLIPGISINQESTGTTGYKISIRGMPYQYTLFLLDGKRQNVSPTVFSNERDTIFTSFMPPLASIQQIEVIRGPMSTLYGSDAIGGVVNIITKRNFEKWQSHFSLSTTLQEKSAFSNIYTGSFYTAGPIDKAKHFGIALRGSESYRSFVSVKNMTMKLSPLAVEKVPTDPSQTIAQESNNYNIGGRLSYSPSKANYLYLDYEHGEVFYNKFPTYERSKKQKFSKNNAILAHLGSYDFGQTDSSIQYNSAGLKDGRKYTLNGQEKDSEYRGDDIIASTKITLPINSTQLVLGGEYWFSSVASTQLIASTGSKFVNQSNISVFAQNELGITDNLFLTLGLRQNYNFVFGFNSSPRAYLVYNGTDWLTLKGGVSTGYKVPTAAQLVDGAYGSSGFGETLRIHYGNPDLKPESSINFEGSMIFEIPYATINITGFYNKFVDKILEGKAGNKLNIGDTLPVGKGIKCDVGGFGKKTTTNCFYTVNVDEAITYGAETSLEIAPIAIGIGDLGLNLNYALTLTEQTKGKNKGNALINVPAHNLNGSLNYFFQDFFSLYLRGEFYAKQPKNGPGWILSSDGGVPSLEDIQKAPGNKKYFNSYFLLHLGGAYNISKHLKLDFGIYNLLNQDFNDWYDIIDTGDKNKLTQVNNYNYLHEGRRYFISISADF